MRIPGLLLNSKLDKMNLSQITSNTKYAKPKLTKAELEKRNSQLERNVLLLENELGILRKLCSKWLNGKEQNAYSFHNVTKAACLFFDLMPNDLFRRTRKEQAIRGRHAAMWILKKHGPYSLKAIGEYYGNRDHTTVINAVAMVENYIEAPGKKSEEFHYYFIPFQNFLEELDNFYKLDLDSPS